MSDPSEQWRPIAGYEDLYEVSDQGRVRSWRNNRWGGRSHEPRILRPILIGPRRIYLQVNLGRGVHRQVAHLVLEAFVGPRPEGYVCCHNDDDSSDNALSNLRWDTPRANYDDRTRNGGQSRGQRARYERLRAARAISARSA